MDTTILFYAKKLLNTVSSEKIEEYLLFCDSLPEQKPSNNLYTEKHHTIPRFLCKENPFLIRIQTNIKCLLVSDHILAHEKLMAIYPCLQTKTAYLMIVRTCKRLGFNIDDSTLNQFDQTREWLRLNTPWRNGPSKEQREKSRKTHSDKHIGKGSRLYHKGDIEIRVQTEQEWAKLESEGWIRGRSERIRKLVTAGVRKACSSFKGTVIMRKGEETIRVPVNEGVLLRKQGWLPINHPVKTINGTAYVTNGLKTKLINASQIQEYEAQGWWWGFTRNVPIENCT